MSFSPSSFSFEETKKRAAAEQAQEEAGAKAEREFEWSREPRPDAQLQAVKPLLAAVEAASKDAAFVPNPAVEAHSQHVQAEEEEEEYDENRSSVNDPRVA